ncbi:adenosylmethionine decarboxylase [Enterococcus sp. BWM-S5]|uniref:S-adenosylmethionine decarboxylase proenzyme n=1 Tax=Enterococcus larvae TaxID=2794352 RepID=A0ABS4CJS6_9ENTE|nr:adenosylmethionine decarboxylase [Enterococcus larvae]MBP1046859.1 adenosylmethionine decarboxylase [Enterococcus larvae]
MNIAKTIKTQTNLREPEAVINLLLIELYLRKQLSTKKLAHKVKLPLPIVSAIKKELIKLDFASEEQGTRLTRKGVLYVEQHLGWASVNKTEYLKIVDSKEEQEHLKKEMVRELRTGISDRPVVAVAYDQAFATIETIVERAFLLLERPDFINKRILFLGDDDLSSLAVGLLLKKFQRTSTERKDILTVYELSEAIIHCIETTANKLGLTINCQQIDFRRGSQERYDHQFDYIYVDPPYTLSGLKLFLSRAVSCSKLGDSRIFLSFGEKDPANQLAIQKLFCLQNLVLVQLRPAFNQYSGASVIGGLSTLYELSTQTDSYATILADQPYYERIYTAELNPRQSIYQCQNCRETYVIGAQEPIKTIEELKRETCSVCKNDTFLRSARRKQPELKTKQYLGNHYLIELKGGAEEKLTSVSAVEEIMLEIVRECELTAVTHYFHQFDPWGVSGVVILSESHFTIHTWPEESYAAVDLFVCCELPSQAHFLSLLVSMFELKAIEYQKINRGELSVEIK